MAEPAAEHTCEWPLEIGYDHSVHYWKARNVNSILQERWERWPPASEEAVVIDIARPLADRFLEQADKWQRETEHLSSPTQIMLHPSYQAILGMARDNETELVRLMLRDLRDNRRLWFWALSYLTKENPIKQTDVGKMDKMIRAWVEWGKQTGRLQ